MSTVKLWWDEVIRMIFIIVNNYCYLCVSCLLQWGYDVSRAVFQRRQAAPGNTLLPFSMKHAFTILHKTLPFPKYGHKCLKLITEDNNEENKETQNSFWSSLNWENRTSKNETCSISYKLTVSFPKGLYSNNHIIYLPPNPTSWKLFVQCKLVTSMKDKSGHKIIIWKSTDAPVARNLWTVGWQVLHYAAAVKVQHTLVWKQKKKSYMHGYGTCMWQSRPTFEG